VVWVEQVKKQTIHPDPVKPFNQLQTVPDPEKGAAILPLSLLAVTDPEHEALLLKVLLTTPQPVWDQKMRIALV
jgi:metal-sulfur cluster biosynthetic enzyme